MFKNKVDLYEHLWNDFQNILISEKSQDVVERC